jgi:hypothetical protein
MKKLFHVIAYTLALNFLAVAGGAGYLFRSGHLDRQRLTAIKAVLFPAPAPATTTAAGRGGPSATQPSAALDELVKKAAGLPSDEQVQLLQHSYDSRMAELDLRQRQLADQQRQIDFGRDRLTAERAALEADKAKFAAQQQVLAQTNDQGFQDSLALYSAMPAKQVKTVFMTLGDETMMKYLEAMPARTATKIIKEFKTPDEMDRIQKVLERMRLRSESGPTTAPSSTAQLTPGGPL